MKTTKYFALAALTLALGACSDENEFYGDSKQITIEAGFGGSSRVATNGLSSMFEADDAIGVYVWTGGTTLPDAATGYVANNVTNTFDGKNWTATPQMLWKDAETPHYFLSVYPQTDILTTTTYTLDATDQEKSDLLVATNFGKDNGGIVAQSNPVPLAFGHVMAKLRVNIKFNDEFTTAPTVEHVTVGAHATATIDWQTATATATGNATGIELPALATAAQGYACSYESVMVPQSGFKSVVMVIGGETYTFTSNQAMQLKKGTITTLNLTVGLSSIQAEDISILDWTTGASIDGYLNNISEQITAIKASLVDLEAVDTELNALIKALQDAEGDHEAQIAALKAKDTELDGKIAALQAYVNSEITATEDWATATFATLAQYQAVLNDIADINLLIEQNKTAIEDITNDLASMQTAINNLHTSMQTWVNEQLQEPLADIATLQADLTNLSNSVATDQELADAIAAQQTALNNAKTALETAYQTAIEDAIDTNNGEITTQIATAIDSAKAELQGKIDTINNEISGIKTRLNNLEARIQSIRFIPEYSDGKVELTSLNTPVTLKFMVSPAAAAKAVELAYARNDTVVTAFISRTKSRADATVDPTAINVTAVEGTEAGILTVTVNTENLPADYWADAEDANLFIRISDGNNDVISEMIPTTYIPYLTFTVGGEQSLVLNVMGELDSSIKYSADGGAWKEFKMSNITGEYGMLLTDPVDFTNNLRMRGKSASGTVTTNTAFMISFTENTLVTCSGDIRTLVDYTNYETTSTATACFFRLFMNCSALYDASGLKLISNNNEMAESCYAYMFLGCERLTSAPELPAEKLAESCYASMFAGCSNLTTAPELPATTLAASCYLDMFMGCSNLTTAPALPAEKLAESCYDTMFSGCTSLTSAPTLPATTLAVDCYNQMFGNCTSLTSAPALSAENLADRCYQNMFVNCTSLESAPVLSAETLFVGCYRQMFSGCTSLESAPVLPAKTLAPGCYNQMFAGCSNLNSITMLATDISATNCLKDWMYGVPTGDGEHKRTFTKHKDMESLPTGVNGIPSGWTVQDYVAPGEGI